MHSRQTTHTGSRCSRCIASRNLGDELGMPSVAMTTTTFCPRPRSFSATGSSALQMLLTVASSGVPPDGDLPISALSPLRST